MSGDTTEGPEKGLREREEQLRILCEGIKDYAILTLDSQGHVSSWSSCAERMKGYRSEEILGKSFTCFYTQEDRKQGRPGEVLRLAEVAGHFEEEGWRVRQDGSRFWANVAITALRDDCGRLCGFSKITRDITDRKRDDERLWESEQKFRAVFESSPDAVIIVDEKGAITLVNAKTETLFGYVRTELVGQLVEILIPASLRPGHARHRSAYGRMPRTRTIGAGTVFKGLRKDGAEFPVEVSLSPIQTAHGSWVAASVRDVTDFRIVELELVAARQRAEDANRSKTEFLAAMSHEIRTPMNAILGMSDLLWESDLNTEQRQYVEVFKRAGSNLLNLIDAILDLTKIEAGHFELEKLAFNLEDVLDHIVELSGGEARKKNIALLVRIAPGLGADLIGDAGRLRQVLLNLVGNAVKFTDEGEIVIAAQSAESGSRGHVRFTVSDTGIGIPPDKLEVIFDDFVQADSSTTRRFGGTGLGLGISRRIVERMGGSLTAVSTVAKGSTFQFDAVFGLAEPNSRRPQKETEDFHGRRVLLVDSNPTDLLILRETLGSWGLVSDAVRTAVEALTALAHAQKSPSPYSLVILDSRMRDMDGMEAVRAMRNIEPQVPLIMLSSELASGGPPKLGQGGLSGYAVKPVKRADLLRMICNAMTDANAPEPADSCRAGEERSGSDGNHPLRILIAEDSPDNRLLVQAYLKNSPYVLTFVEDGKQALEGIAARSFDLILMDIQMPVMDGLTATRAIRALQRERSGGLTPIIALTANARQQDIEMSARAGCDGHLSKPISKQRLIETIEKYGRRNDSPSPYPRPLQMSIPEDLQDLVPGYLSARRAELHQLTTLLAARNFGRLGSLAHDIKGSGGSFGFPDLTRLGGALETSAQNGDPAAVQDILAQLGDYLDRVQLVS